MNNCNVPAISKNPPITDDETVSTKQCDIPFFVHISDNVTFGGQYSIILIGIDGSGK